MKVIKGGITSPKGFLASSVSCGIKKSGRNDLALLFSESPGLCAGQFTVNRFRSGSVSLSQMRIKKGLSQAIIANSGNANACVGKREIKDAEIVTEKLAGILRLDRNKVLIASTGIIGKSLPVMKIKKKIPDLVKGLKKVNGTRFSKAIMTTDTVHKECAVSVRLGNKDIRIGGAAKGSGMICPKMATMLAFFTTDALIERHALESAFRESVAQSFNRITVDGDMSTNDTAIIFANGIAGNRRIKKGSPDYHKFLTALKFLSIQLAKKIVLDGEGATRFVEIVSKGARDAESAEKVARSVAVSSLVKTMIAGGDPNWGRIASSVGSSGVKVDKEKVEIYLGKKLVMKNGAGTKVPRNKLLDVFKKKEIDIVIDLKSGRHSAKIWTCDLTEDYVKINAGYST
ncbi:MAG: bifunctional glutamate N-acetyltransferase/amino-acid acetyltransferase ArgJ [Candidatus Omnitrophica bacterium]|nr:bifunctional glutamate N-acetyltransferase/amino-acid acetyltransferase ArgJ [Candidatus Omnitrophota bacterium]